MPSRGTHPARLTLLLPPCVSLQLFATSREVKSAPVAAWRAAWRRLAASFAIGWAASAAAAWLAGHQPASSSYGAWMAWVTGSSEVPQHALPVAWQLLWASAAGLAATAGLPAMLAALSSEGGQGGSGSSSSSGSSKEGSQPAELAAASTHRQVQLCSLAAGLAAVVLQAAHWLMGQWVRCFVFLLGALPLYGLAARQPPSWLSKVAALAAVAATAGAAAAGNLPAWLWGSLLPHALMVVHAVL